MRRRCSYEDHSRRTFISIDFFTPFFPVNCYLVEEDDSLTLIDAALPYSAKKILKAAKKLINQLHVFF